MNNSPIEAIYGAIFLAAFGAAIYYGYIAIRAIASKFAPELAARIVEICEED